MKQKAKQVVFAAVLLAWGGIALAGAATGFQLGVGISIHDDIGAMNAVKGLGATSVRVDAPWSQVEVVDGVYQIPAWLEKSVELARRNGLEPLLILAYGNKLHGTDKPSKPEEIAAYAAYANFVVTHFKGRVRYFDLWNEWETHTGRTAPGSVDQYIALARAVSPVIKKANPDALVLSGGISDIRANNVQKSWLAEFIGKGGLRYFDALSIHPYVYSERNRDTDPEVAIGVIDDVEDLARKASDGRDVDIYVTEFGYPAYSGRFGVREDMQSDFLVRFVLLANARSYVRGVWWYCLKDQGIDPTNKEHHFGLYTSTMEKKPAADAFSLIANQLRTGKLVSVTEGSEYMLRYKKNDGECTVQWRRDAETPLFHMSSSSSPLCRRATRDSQ